MEDSTSIIIAFLKLMCAVFLNENKAQIKQALNIIRTVQTYEIYANDLASIQKALSKLSHNAAKHEGLLAASNAIANQIDSLVASLQTRRKRHKKEEEQILAWLSNPTSNPFLQHE